MFIVCWLWGEVLCAWRDTIFEGQNHYSTPALGSYTGCSGMIPAYGMFHVLSHSCMELRNLTLLVALIDFIVIYFSAFKFSPLIYLFFLKSKCGVGFG